MVFWHPKGGRCGARSRATSGAKLEAAGLSRVKTPQARRSQAVGGIGPLGEVPREHVSQRERGRPEREFVADPEKRIFALKR